MRKSCLIMGSLLLVTFALVNPVTASFILLPNDDTFLDQTSGGTVRDNGGILIKGQSGQQRIGIIEFTLPDVTVESATLNLLHVRSWSDLSWKLQVSGKQAEFDETAITWNNSTLQSTVGVTLIGDPLTMVGGNSGQDVVPPQWRTVDMTDFFNANKGTTVTLFLKNTDNDGQRGGTIEDREGSRTGDPANGPYISYVPEPSSLLCLGLASLALVRRRFR